MLSQTEENYLKGIMHLTIENPGHSETGTNDLAGHLGVRPASVNDMLKKLKEKKLIHYEKYGKISLTADGKRQATEIIRKHRLWETFLYEKLHFTWDEVHEVAEQLEHIQSSKLIDKLDALLNHPKYDPHGDVIPNAKGEMVITPKRTLNEEVVGHQCTMVAVKDNSATFLQYVNKVGLGLDKKMKVLSRQPFDNTLEIEVNGKPVVVSPRFASHIVVVCPACDKKKNKKD